MIRSTDTVRVSFSLFCSPSFLLAKQYEKSKTFVANFECRSFLSIWIKKSKNNVPCISVNAESITTNRDPSNGLFFHRVSLNIINVKLCKKCQVS